MTIRRNCSTCGEDLGFSESDPCDMCSMDWTELNGDTSEPLGEDEP